MCRSGKATKLNFLLKPRDSCGNFTSEISARPRLSTLGPSSNLAVGILFKSQQINQGCWFKKMISSGYEEVGIRCGHATASNQKVWEGTSRLPCYLFCICILTYQLQKLKSKNPNQLSWAINKGSDPRLESKCCIADIYNKTQIANTGPFITLKLTDVMKLPKIQVNWNKVPNHRRTLFITRGRFHENKSIIVGNHWCVTVGVWYGRMVAITQVYTAHPLHHPPTGQIGPLRISLNTNKTRDFYRTSTGFCK